MAVYTATLRSQRKDRMGPEILREFGGSEGRRLEYGFDTIEFESAGDDETALRRARNIARRKNMFLLRVERIVYRRKAPLPRDH